MVKRMEEGIVDPAGYCCRRRLRRVAGSAGCASWARTGARPHRAAIVAVVFFATLPLYYDVHNGQWGIFFFTVFCYGIVAQGWNLVAGYTGQISLGQNAFFGLGAFTTALLWFWNVTHTGYWFDPVLMILSAIAPDDPRRSSSGVPLLSRLRGDYFSFGTLGMGMIISVIFLNGGKHHRRQRRQTAHQGHARGRDVQPAHRTTTSGLIVAIIATVVVYCMTNSRIGLALKAIREDEVSAASHGINVLKYKVISFAVAAGLAGLAGSVYTYYLLHPMPMNVFAQTWLFLPILMVVLGGTGTIYRALDRRARHLLHRLVRGQVLPRLAPGHPGRHHHRGHAVHAGRHLFGLGENVHQMFGDEARALGSGAELAGRGAWLRCSLRRSADVRQRMPRLSRDGAAFLYPGGQYTIEKGAPVAEEKPSFPHQAAAPRGHRGEGHGEGHRPDGGHRLRAVHVRRGPPHLRHRLQGRAARRAGRVDHPHQQRQDGRRRAGAAGAGQGRTRRSKRPWTLRAKACTTSGG